MRVRRGMVLQIMSLNLPPLEEDMREEINGALYIRYKEGKYEDHLRANKVFESLRRYGSADLYATYMHVRYHQPHGYEILGEFVRYIEPQYRNELTNVLADGVALIRDDANFRDRFR